MMVQSYSNKSGVFLRKGMRIMEGMGKGEWGFVGWEDRKGYSGYKFQVQMQVLHSIEIQKVLKEDMSHKLMDSSSDNNTTADSTHHSHATTSHSSIPPSPSGLTLLQQRFNSLERQYQNLLHQTRSKSSLKQRQKQQILELQSQHEYDRKEIQRLQSLLAIGSKVKKEGLKKGGQYGRHRFVPQA